MNKIKAVIFDFDETIADSSVLIFYSFNYVIKTLSNAEIKGEDVVKYFGPSEEGIFNNIYKDDKELSKKAFQMYLSFYEENHLKYLPKVDDKLIDIFNYLISNNIKLYVLTGRSKESLEISLDKLNISRYFEKNHYTGSLYGVNKGENLINLLKDNNYKNDEVIYIGDSPSDVIECNKVNIQIISTLIYRKVEREEVIKLNKDNIVRTFDEFKDKLKDIIN